MENIFAFFLAFQPHWSFISMQTFLFLGERIN